MQTTAASALIPPTMRVFERGWLSSNNVLLFDDDSSATLVDTGYVSHRTQTLALAIFHDTQLGRDSRAGALAAVTVALAFATLWAREWLAVKSNSIHLR